MNKKMLSQLISICCLSAIILLISSCSYHSDTVSKANKSLTTNSEKNTLNPSQLINTYGFSNNPGNLLITLSNQEASLAELKDFNIAIGNKGQIIPIAYEKKQSPQKPISINENSSNFEYLDGHLYRALNGKFLANHTYLLTNDKDFPLKSLVPLVDTELENNKFPVADTKNIEQFQVLKNRKIIESRLLAKTKDNNEIDLFIFEEKNKEMLATIAYCYKGQMIYKDFPAKLDASSSWRVDSGTDPGLFEVMFLAKCEEGFTLGLTWTGPEGENILILKTRAEKFIDTPLNNYRYFGSY